jgi:hypothetical protein
LIVDEASSYDNSGEFYVALNVQILLY